MTIIANNRSLVVAADVRSSHDFHQLAEALKGVSGIGGIKYGKRLAIRDLQQSVKIGRFFLPHCVTIYDGQKEGTDIPEMGDAFAEDMKEAGIDAAILFPFAGPITQERWTKACMRLGIKVIIGSVMTHQMFLAKEGGYLADDAPERMFKLACDTGVTDFVVPGTKLNWVIQIREWVSDKLGEGNYALYSPGFITQGGDIGECGKVAGNKWHPIVGSAIYKQTTMEARREAASTVTRKLVNA